jgi:prepilin-type N-terminal cleavage/methylation domain-containing protein
MRLPVVRTRLVGESGFTLLELLMVMSVVGTLLGIAVPSMVGFTGYARQVAAEADLREAVPAAEDYATETGSYTGLTRAALVSIDPGIAGDVDVLSADDGGYCLYASGRGVSVQGPGGALSWYSNTDCTGTPLVVND